ncbi:hypothetical protein N8803_02035 [Gammaproteobacteria bacterium]|nr:hypothetical protein [Gammaproteobacteria bacterium]MDA7710135.1 hypothetical protein [Gammaproteobacteria bacterium]
MIEGWTDINLREKSKEELENKLSELNKLPWGELDREKEALRNKILSVLSTLKKHSQPNSTQPNSTQPNSKYSLNAYLADTTIAFVGFFFFIIVALLIYISYKIGQWFGGGLGFDIFIIGLVFIILNFGLFAIFAEIYRHLKEINSKTKHPDKD